MRLRNRLLLGVAVGAMLASSGAMAALDAQKVYFALTSLKLALVKIGVANAMLANPKPPANNAEAHVAAPNQLGSQEISAIVVSDGVINVYLTPAVGVTDGVVQLVPQIVTDKDGKRGVQYTCYSPNMANIADAVKGCTYHPAN